MRALVASLESALAFVKALTGALPMITQLLASSTVSDVHDAIGLLISYSKFGINGSQAALRKMLPLVFSADPSEPAALMLPCWRFVHQCRGGILKRCLQESLHASGQLHVYLNMQKKSFCAAIIGSVCSW
jgi:hypothetical protein